MPNLTRRQMCLISILYQAEGWLTAKELAKRMKVSERTVQTEIQLLRNGLLPSDCIIESVAGLGSRILIRPNFTRFDLVSGVEINSQSDDIIDRLMVALCSNELQDLDLLSDHYYISRSTLDRHLFCIQNYLEKNNFELQIVKRHNGANLSGDERWQRKLITFVLTRRKKKSKFKIQDIGWYLDESTYTMIESIVEKVLKNEGIILSKEGVDDVILHTAVAEKRLTEGNELFFSEEECLLLLGASKFASSSIKIWSELSKFTGVKAQTSEIAALAQRIIYQYNHAVLETKTINEWKIRNNLSESVRDILKKTKETFQIDFTNDERVVRGLMVHMLNVLSNPANINSSLFKNPLRDIVKEQYPFPFELAVFVSKEMMSISNRNMNEDEISNIALYFVAALDRKRTDEADSQIELVFVCDKDYASSLYLFYKLESFLGDVVKCKGPFSYYDSVSNQFQYADLIVSTRTIEQSEETPVVMISELMAPIDVRLIQAEIFSILSRRHHILVENLFNPDFFTIVNEGSYLPTVTEMCKILEEEGVVNKGFCDSTLERELISTTVMPNMVAIPHSLLPLAEKTTVSVAIFKEPVKYLGKKVKIIFLLAIKDGEQKYLHNFYNFITETIQSPKSRNELMAIGSYDELINIVKKSV